MSKVIYMHKLTNIWVAAAMAATITGCSSMFQKDEQEVEEEPVEVQTLTYGVSHFEDRRSFVIYESGYEHVVLPSGRSVMYRKGWDDDQIARMASALDENQGEPNKAETSDAKASDDNDQSGTQNYTDPVERAWAKLCRDEIEKMTDGDWFIITTTEMPDSLKSWCDENTARHRVK